MFFAVMHILKRKFRLFLKFLLFLKFRLFRIYVIMKGGSEMEMTNMITEVQLDEQVQRQLKSTNSLFYMKVLKLADELSQMQQNLYKELTEAEKKEVRVVMSKAAVNNNPEHLTNWNGVKLSEVYETPEYSTRQNGAKAAEVYEIPEYLTTQDVAKMLHISPQMVRRYCANGDIKATQRMGGTGAWLIETSQYLDHPGLRNVLAAKEVKRKKSLGFANSMLELLDE